jgi:hypothetical protein
MEPIAQQIQDTEQHLDNPIFRKLSLWSLLLRIIPLMTSFLLFVFAISIDASRWGNSFLQVIIAIAIILGAIGIGLFIPKRI